jgi:UDP-N-acetylglucosamine 2-epimerase (non-hydrolysing)
MLFTPSQDGNANLAREGIPEAKIHLVGNVMIDTLVRMLPAAQRCLAPDLPKQYVLTTLHRPSNVDDLDWLVSMLRMLDAIGRDVPVFFPIHPRTRQRLTQAQADNGWGPGLRLLDPLPYIEFLALQTRATVVVTDSGGIQEETTFLGRPCLTVRENTERPVTVEIGTNILAGRDVAGIRQEIMRILQGDAKRGGIPPLWDGHAGERIAAIVASSC